MCFMFKGIFGRNFVQFAIKETPKRLPQRGAGRQRQCKVSSRQPQWNSDSDYTSAPGGRALAPPRHRVSTRLKQADTLAA